MELCEYGCGKEATHTFKNGKKCCAQKIHFCESFNARRGAASGNARKGVPFTEEHRKKLKGRGVGRIVDSDLRKRISDSNKKHWSNVQRVAWNKGVKTGHVPWNKGLQKRQPIAPIPGDDPIYSDFKKYRNRVSARTRREYKIYKEEINPNGYPLGKCGVEGAYQIDHIVSVRKGFEQQIPVEVISAKDNLQVIPWLDNIRKYDS